MAIPRDFIDTLSERIDIVDVIGSYVTLTKKGGDFWACCPFHNEKTPSFSVSPSKQMYYCFGCKKGGGVFNFVMEEENLSFPDAVRFLAKRAGLEVPEDGNDIEDSRRRTRLLELNRRTALFYYHLLKGREGQAVREYLAGRRIQWKTAVKFGMGAAPDTWDTLLREMRKHGYSDRELVDAGLVVKGKRGLYDKFRNRLMLPVINTRGDVVGFGSRILSGDGPKYMNSPDTLVYDKWNVIYGLNLAKKTKRPNLILCEGNLDVVTLHQAGFDNAVATMGTALTVKHTRILSRFTKELIVCMDNDRAGKAATEKALQILNNSELSVRVLQLPNRMVDGIPQKQDPDDFIKNHGADAFERLLTGSENGTDFRLEQIAGKYDLNTDEGRLAYSTEAKEIIASLQSSVGRDIYTQRAAETVGVGKEAMESDVQRTAKIRYYQDRKREIQRELNPAAYGVQPEERSLHYENPKSARAEEGIIRLFLLDASIFPDELPLKETEFSLPLYGKVFTLLWNARQEHRPVSLGLLASELTREEMSQITTICQQPESTQNADKALADYIRIVREQSANEEDPLVAAMEKNKRKKRTGGQQV